MPTGSDVVAKAIELTHLPGIRYGSWDCSARCEPRQSGCEDCSGMTSADLTELGVGAGCEGSFFQSRRFHAAGTGMSFEQAVKTPGAFGFVGVNEGQGGTPGVDPGHVGIFVGDDQHTVEARGHWAGVGIFIARSIVWDWCGMPPGVNDPVGVPVPPIPELPPLAVQEDDNMTTLVLPDTRDTTHGRVPTARAVRGYNFVLLENGARLAGDVTVDTTGNNKSRHWWAPPEIHTQVPGAQILDVADLRVRGEGIAPENAIVATYGAPNGAILTYKARIIRPQ